ncbi:hypothetical protein BDD43_4355 [Mucilaginibacter gracilis]|uniref:Uncharacterized protein n=1 Tax=Mucilaginibacter gracilis TaxID=423350 RepID=A0A495J6T2_9SPHI|nr:hypothetical protein [Mucilaginibacter gracilis]RKR84128.1 hypothetical protein BDD43_4355 [Mucilaginibacter gracilis]
MATTYDLTTLADSLKASAITINQRIHDDIANMDFHEIQELTNKSQDLIIKSKTLYEMAAINIANDGKAALDTLAKAQDDILHAIKTIKTVQTVIDITAKLVVLAGAVITGNVATIVSTAGDITSSL